jgi:hypothetical protein
VDDLARRALADGGTGRAHARAVLLHPEFRGARVRTELVRSPLELVVAMAKVTGTKPSAIGGLDALWRSGHLPFLPPNVGGWPGARSMAAVGTFWETASVAAAAVAAATSLPSAGGNLTVAARNALRWAGVLDPSAATLTAVADYVSLVRSDPSADRARHAAAVALLTPDFAAGGG